MKKIFTIITLLSVFIVNAQDDHDNNDILLGAYVADQIEHVPSNALSLLKTRMYQLVTTNGISGNLFKPRFFLYPKIAVLDKEVLGTAPTRIILNLEVTLFVGDVEEEKGNVFQTKVVTLKGIGQNEQKAYISAIKRLAPKNPKIIAFLDDTKKEIINYYEEHCEEVKKKAYSLKAQDKTDEAVIVLANIPISTKCYSKNEKDIGKFYQKVLDQKCRKSLNEARAAWYTNQSMEGAEKAGTILAEIEPRAWCKDQLKSLYDEIAEGVREIGGKEWELVLKQADAEIESTGFSRELILEYIKNQPRKTVRYNISRWY
ncbi:hypothetical protein [Maribacter sp. 2304DJ31-5]|uniref:hypothetical protein n=1 Tax=Maribacter sp. 2304DJ31-5 TaxID=3386273 RepID=UPI0039BD6E14